MTDEKKYIELLKTLGEIIIEKNNTIAIKDYAIESLKESLKLAEAELLEKRACNE